MKVSFVNKPLFPWFGYSFHSVTLVYFPVLVKFTVGTGNTLGVGREIVLNLTE